MNRNENVFLAKKLFTELVYNTAYIEGCNVTFPQTQTIIDGAVVNNVSVDDIQTVLNLRDGWKYSLNHLDLTLDISYICKVNEHISRNESLAWGTLRTGAIDISGTEYKPTVPNKETVETHLTVLESINPPLERALAYFAYIVKNQLFWDGNKRTATIVANKILIENGAGVLTIGKYHAEKFNEALLHYYNDESKKEGLFSVLRSCIKTLDF